VKQYELTVLIHPDLEMNLTPALDKIKKLIESHDGKIVKEVNEGKKRLAYPIEKEDYAVYYAFDLELPAQAPAKISSTLNTKNSTTKQIIFLHIIKSRY